MKLAEQLPSPQIIIVDDQALADSCQSIINGHPWRSLSLKGDYAPFKGEKCVVVARAGQAGSLNANAHARKLIAAGATEVKVVTPEPSRPEGWSLGDALRELWDGKRILDWLKANAQKYEQRKPGRALADVWAARGQAAELRRQQHPNYPIWREWALDLSGNGGPPLANLNNAVAILEKDTELDGLVWNDEFLQRLMTGSPPREWTDADDINLALYMQRGLGLAKMGREVVNQAALSIAYRNPRNCVRDWLDSLTHDATARVDDFFTDCFGAEPSEYTQAASRNFWLSMVARVYRPGCKVDNMIVLEGSQGLGKSSALQIIGGEWFAEQHESATNPKGFAEILQGKLLIEISEMDSFNRAEVNRVKQTVSCPADRFRVSYGRYANDHPRQCVFVGTTNRDDWNRDETGARRFWPIACRGGVRLDLVRENREQLFAEAVVRYKAGEPHWIMPDGLTRDEQAARYQADPWLEQIEHIVKGEDTVTTAHVAEKLGIDMVRRDRYSEMRIGTCLRFLGWSKEVRRVAGKPMRVFVLKALNQGSPASR